MKYSQSVFKLLFLSILLISLSTQGMGLDTANIDLNSRNKSTRINALTKLAGYYYFIVGDISTSDSLANEAYIESNLLGNQDLLFSTSIIYGQYADAINQKDRAIRYLTEAEKMAKKKNQKSKIIQAVFTHTKLLINSKDFKTAQDILQENENIIVDDKKARITYNLLLGEIFEMKLSKASAYKNYSNAMYLAIDIEDDSLLLESYRRLYKFYSKNKDKEKALGYYDSAKSIISTSKNISEYDKLYFSWELVQIYRITEQYELAIPLAYDVIEKSKKLNYQLIKNYCSSSLRSILLDNNNYSALYDFYQVKYPDELSKLEKNAPVAFYRIKSMLFEYNHNYDSSLAYFNKGDSLVDQSPNMDYKAYYYKRKAEYFLRNNKIEQAILNYEKTVELGQKAIDLSFVIDGSHILDSLFTLNRNLEKSYYYLALNKKYADSNNAINQNEKIAFAEMMHNTEIERLLNKKKEIKKEKEHALQIEFILLLITFLIVLLVVFSNSSISRWVIKLHGYLTFVFLFEFIIYMLESVYHAITHREEESPLELMIIKSILVALLLPLHHWSEKQVVHFLLNHNMLNRIKLLKNQLKNKLSAILKKTN